MAFRESKCVSIFSRSPVARVQRILLTGLCTTSFKGVAKAALYCAHRTSTVSSCAFCEQEGHLAAPPHPSEAARCASTLLPMILPSLLVALPSQGRHPVILNCARRTSTALP